ncbi:DUF2624 domain-containing protein [Bacillus smithii]|uniref:DUF2624 domain-containing protein n=1 Tax=Bacillus smithii TaxID=1479 RepID=UPI0030C95A78
MKFIQTMINHKISTMTGTELYKWGKQFKISITKEQAEAIAAHLRGKKIDLFDDKQRTQLIKEIAKIIGPKKAKEINELFILFMNSE